MVSCLPFSFNSFTIDLTFEEWSMCEIRTASSVSTTAISDSPLTTIKRLSPFIRQFLEFLAIMSPSRTLLLFSLGRKSKTAFHEPTSLHMKDTGNTAPLSVFSIIA